MATPRAPRRTLSRTLDRALARTLAAVLLSAPLLLPAAARAACPADDAVRELAARLLRNEPVPPPGPGMSLADGLCAQEKLSAIMAGELGRPVGWKVGLTNAAAQARFNTPHPLVGPIYEGTVRARSGDTLPARFAAVPVVEADLVVRVRDSAINGAGTDHVAILRHLDQVVPFIELPDLALAELGKMDGPNLLAIGVGARLGVVGDAFEPPATAEFARRLGAMTVRFNDDRRELASVPGTALLDHPLNVIPWLVSDLAARGAALKPGDLVSLGGFSPAVPAEAGRTYTVTYDGLRDAPVSVSVSLR